MPDTGVLGERKITRRMNPMQDYLEELLEGSFADYDDDLQSEDYSEV